MFDKFRLCLSTLRAGNESAESRSFTPVLKVALEPFPVAVIACRYIAALLREKFETFSVVISKTCQ